LFILHSAGLYPEKQVPLCFLKGVESARLHEIQVLLLNKSEELMGETSVFQLHSYLEEIMGKIKKEPSAKYIAAYNAELKLLIESLDHDIDIYYDRDNTEDDVQNEEENNGDVDGTDIESESTRTSATSGRQRADFWTPLSHSRMSPSTSPHEIMKIRETLPAWASKSTFLGMLTSSRAVVVTGETGCGKTTQIPQFISEYDPQSKIIVCQPRRLAAVGVASRVADEMGSRIGDTVGYMVRGEAKAGARTSIVFCEFIFIYFLILNLGESYY
jgi:hypothetical protein